MTPEDAEVPLNIPFIRQPSLAAMKVLKYIGKENQVQNANAKDVPINEVFYHVIVKLCFARIDQIGGI